jgi:hypothetical protein
MSNEIKNPTNKDLQKANPEIIKEVSASSEIKEAVVEKESVKPEVKKVDEEVAQEKPKKKESFVPDTIVEETGINLIPTMSKEEIKDEDKKKKINTSALISLSVLFSVSILVIGFNIISKIQLNSEKDKLYAHETRMEAYSQVIIDNNEILHRVSLYRDIQDGRFSTKEVIDYLNKIAEKSGSSVLTEFAFSGGTNFRFTGEALDLEDVAKLWYLLSNDSKMKDIELKNVTKGEMDVRFEFSGVLVKEEFVNSVK